MNNEIKTGGPAFPFEDGTFVNGQRANGSAGVTVRDYFAAKVAVGEEIGVRYAEQILGRRMPDYAADPLANAIFWADARARLRYIEADAMLAAREAQS